ncbi:MAG: ABC transporter ATP-binding protein [Opitutae bacterium]
MDQSKSESRMKPFIEIRNLTKTYQSVAGEFSTPVLNNLSLEVTSGRTLGLIGPSGSGKSTLLNIMGGLDVPTSGEVWIDGNQVHQLSPNEAASFRNQTIGFIFQSHHLLPALTAHENVMVPTLAGHRKGSGSDGWELAHQLLEQVGLKERANHRPNQLSGGEKQRVAVARALINRPKLLLADEPTGALDRANADHLMDILLRLNEEFECTMLVVTHSMEQAKRMDDIWSFQDGKLNAIDQ